MNGLHRNAQIFTRLALSMWVILGAKGKLNSWQAGTPAKLPRIVVCKWTPPTVADSRIADATIPARMEVVCEDCQPSTIKYTLNYEMRGRCAKHLQHPMPLGRPVVFLQQRVDLLQMAVQALVDRNLSERGSHMSISKLLHSNLCSLSAQRLRMSFLFILFVPDRVLCTRHLHVRNFGRITSSRGCQVQGCVLVGVRLPC